MKSLQDALVRLVHSVKLTPEPPLHMHVTLGLDEV